ncbi:MAG: hypothetical protein ABIK09_20930, partial [Pseudomonadota bacterium]
DWHASAESLLGLDKKKKVSDFVLQTSIEAEHRDDAELEPYAFTINFETDRITFGEAILTEETLRAKILEAVEEAGIKGLNATAISTAVGGNYGKALKEVEALVLEFALVPAPGQKEGKKKGVRYICAPPAETPPAAD